MNEAEVGAIAFLATVLNELEENKKRTVGQSTDAREGAATDGLQQAEKRIEALTAERNRLREAVTQTCRWAEAWKRSAKRRRVGYLTELSRHERTAQKFREAMGALMQLQQQTVSLPSDAIDVYAEYRENLGLSTRAAKKRALRDLQRRPTR